MQCKDLTLTKILNAFMDVTENATSWAASALGICVRTSVSVPDVRNRTGRSAKD